MKQLSINYQLSFPMATVLDFFSDIELFAIAHPLILSATKITGDGSKFKIRERPYPFLPIKISYFAEVSTKGNQVIYSISGIPLTTFELTFDLRSNDPRTTILAYRIEIESKLIGQGILLSKIKKAQDEIVRTLHEYL